MQRAEPGAVLGDFAQRFEHAGLSHEFSGADGKYAVRTDGPGGEIESFEISYAFGVAPLQQYLVPLPGGRLQALGIAWDTRPRESGGQRWFHLYPDQNLRAGDPQHWTGLDQRWNFMCADCHSTDVRKNYDARTRAYRTSWSELSVGCEACHGPASAHVAWAEDPRPGSGNGLTTRLDERRGVSWSRDPATGQPQRSAPRASEREIEACARCHARRSQLTDEIDAGDSLHDGFRIAVLEPGLYHPDGQVLAEVYEYGSFLQSRMYAAGVTCSDCHEPHTQELRAEGDSLCAQCHDAAKYESPAHHFHSAGPGAPRCVSCHMPSATFMQIDVRHDHSLRVPRPDLSARLGTPDACTSCHAERGARWAAEQIAARAPAGPKGVQQFADAFAGLERGQTGALDAVAAIAVDGSQAPIVRASAWRRLGASRAPVEIQRAALSARDASPLVRGAVAQALAHAGAGAASLLAGLLGDPARSVRVEAASALAGIDPRSLPPSAVEEYERVQRFNADRPESLVNLGTFLAERGEFAEAEVSFAQAQALDPGFLPAWVNLADLHRLRGDEARVEQVLRHALPLAGASGAVHHALGLGLIRQGRVAEALPWLAEASRREPYNRHFALVHAVALHDSGRPREALRALEVSIGNNPDATALRALDADYRREGVDPEER
jgi:predicted CXXCH cytochrome family protein